MAYPPRRLGVTALRLLAAAGLIGCPRVGLAAGTWSVISLPQNAGDMVSPWALAVDGAGNLYVADQANGPRILKRDAAGSWSVIASQGDALGQVNTFAPGALAADGAGNLYVADADSQGGGRIQMRDAQGSWSILAMLSETEIATDAAGNLYTAGDTVRKRDTGGHWSVIASQGDALGQVHNPTGLGADAAGDLYVGDEGDDGQGNNGRIQERDTQGHWSVIATRGDALGQVHNPGGLAVDAAGNLYVTDFGEDGQGSFGRVQWRDVQGRWSVIAALGAALGQVDFSNGAGALAVDAVGRLYVADDSSSGSGRVQEYTPGP